MLITLEKIISPFFCWLDIFSSSIVLTSSSNSLDNLYSIKLVLKEGSLHTNFTLYLNGKIINAWDGKEIL